MERLAYNPELCATRSEDVEQNLVRIFTNSGFFFKYKPMKLNTDSGETQWLLKFFGKYWWIGGIRK